MEDGWNVAVRVGARVAFLGFLVMLRACFLFVLACFVGGGFSIVCVVGSWVRFVGRGLPVLLVFCRGGVWFGCCYVWITAGFVGVVLGGVVISLQAFDEWFTYVLFGGGVVGAVSLSRLCSFRCFCVVEWVSFWVSGLFCLSFSGFAWVGFVRFACALLIRGLICVACFFAFGHCFFCWSFAARLYGVGDSFLFACVCADEGALCLG